ncbi:MAG: hypothetical protein AUK44_08055 [Porphyromonadaceae bacterium CG2_30_38_12]|nr:MAG: hypothetical protein AUK44_08055 [Porphyromonadaceae bacterium CG2_30_38_12]
MLRNSDKSHAKKQLKYQYTRPKWSTCSDIPNASGAKSAECLIKTKLVSMLRNNGDSEPINCFFLLAKSAKSNIYFL